MAETVAFKDGCMEGSIGFDTLAEAMGFIFRIERKERFDPRGRYAFLSGGVRVKRAGRIREDAQCRASRRDYLDGKFRPVDEFLAELENEVGLSKV